MHPLDILAVLGLITGTCFGYVALCAKEQNYRD